MNFAIIMAKQKTNKEADKIAAEIFYMEAGWTQKEIAEHLGYSENTISKWAKDGGWAELKSVKSLTPANLQKELLLQADEIIKKAKEAGRNITPGEMDTIKKITASIEDLDKKNTAAVAMSVLSDFNIYLKQIDLELTKKIIPHEKEFIRIKIASNGSKG